MLTRIWKDPRNRPAMVLLVALLAIVVPVLAQQGNQVIPAASSSTPITITLGPQCATSNTNNCFFAYADAQVAWSSTTSNGSGVVTNSTYSPFKPSDVGKTCYATNASSIGGVNTTSDVVMAEGTITTYTSASSVTCSGLGNAKAGAGTVFVWGHLDTANIAAAWTAAQSSCGTLQLPNGAMLNESAQFNTSTVYCYTGVGSNRRGEAVVGVSPSSTMIILTPNFNFATNTSGHHALFGDVPDGMTAHDFSIWGSGLSFCVGCLSGSNVSGTTNVWYANYQNGSIHDLNILQFAGGQNGITGFNQNCAFCTVNAIQIDAVGGTACSLVGQSSLGNPARLSNSFCGDTNGSLGVSTGATNSAVQTVNDTFGNANVVVNGTGVWDSTNDNFITYTTSIAQDIFSFQANTINMVNATITQTGTGSAFNMQTGSTLNISNSRIQTASGTAFTIDGTSVVNDTCGNSMLGNAAVASITAGGILRNCASEPSVSGRCLAASGASPEACGNSSNGKVAVPATTTTYTVNTTAAITGAEVYITPTQDNSGISGAPTCAVVASPFAQITAISTGVSFTFSLPSNAGVSCFNWSIR